MLDTSNPSETPATAAWRDRLAPGDVVLFRFPLAGPVAAHRPVPRLCLVLDVEIIRGRCCAVLAPAMPSSRTSTPGRRVVVDRRPGWRTAGPERAATFPVRARLIVPLDHDGFVTGETGTPVLGQLKGAAMERMQAERARIHALRDIRAERVQSRDRQRRGAVRGRDFSVERRNIRRPLPLAPVAADRNGT